MDNRELLQQCKEQEERYTFPSIDRNDIWDLGCSLVEECRGYEGPLAVTIWLNGTEVFRYYPAGTGKFHEQWLSRKYNTVTTLEKSSMRFKAELAVKGGCLADECLSETDYAACGGGFPIRLTGGCVIGFIGVSGLSDDRDHAALIGGLRRFFVSRGY